jgi:DNA-binding response OmpR family regulator
MPEGACKHVLLVEDDHPVREIIAEMLEDAGYRVSTANSGTAMHAHLDGSGLVDAVVMDLNLPGEKAVPLALCVADRGLPLVIVSGLPEAVFDARGKQLPILPKPFTREEITAALAAVLGAR